MMGTMSYPNDPKPWEVLDSKYLSRKPWLTVRQDHVRLPSGSEMAEYFVLEYPDWVNVIAITTDDKMVLIRQYRHGARKVHFELPAGVTEGVDGNYETSARRELLEETGYGGGQWQHWMTVSANPSTNSNRSHTYLARDVIRLQEQKLESTEDVTVHLLPLDKVRKQVLGDGFLQAMNIAPLLKFFLLEAGV
jgi:8-oxo-dGTP pyrophosphatase MutT (NUDIX family)